MLDQNDLNILEKMMPNREALNKRIENLTIAMIGSFDQERFERREFVKDFEYRIDRLIELLEAIAGPKKSAHVPMYTPVLSSQKPRRKRTSKRS